MTKIDAGALEEFKAIIAEKFAPAIDFKAPYARVMLDVTARALLAEAIRALAASPPKEVK